MGRNSSCVRPGGAAAEIPLRSGAISAVLTEHGGNEMIFSDRQTL